MNSEFALIIRLFIYDFFELFFNIENIMITPSILGSDNSITITITQITFICIKVREKIIIVHYLNLQMASLMCLIFLLLTFVSLIYYY